MWARKAANDPSRFEGEGISYKAKLIGIEDVKEARGDQMCQEALLKLKSSARIAGGHKRKILVTVTLEGLKIIDAISLIVLHAHDVHQISFISRDPSDGRAFGYIYETEDGLHKFFAIKTATAAEQLVLTLKDLFQAVYEIKKKEVDSTKEKPETGEISASVENETPETLKDLAASQDGQAPSPSENNNQIITNSTAISPEVQTEPEVRSEPIANLFDLEDMADNILKGIEQVNSLEFEFLTKDAPSPTSPTSPVVKVSPPTTAVTTSDPWGLTTAETSTKPTVTSSALGDLAGLQTGPFSTSFPMQSGFGGSPTFNTITGSLHVTKDPFGSDPFSPFLKKPDTPAVGFGVTNPFGTEFNQPYGIQGIPSRMGTYSMMPGMVPHGIMSPPARGVLNNPFATQQSAGPQAGNPFGDPTHLQATKGDTVPDSNSNGSDVIKARSKSPHDNLFSDLLDIKKSSPVGAKSPKDMFAQLTIADKKSMNALIASPRSSPVPSAMQLKPGISPRSSPVPTMQAKLGVSPRASPVPTIQLQPGRSPQDSPVPVMQLPPGVSPRASPVPTLVPTARFSPSTSPVPAAQTIPAQSIPFDDFFGGPLEPVSGPLEPVSGPPEPVSNKWLLD